VRWNRAIGQVPSVSNTLSVWVSTLTASDVSILGDEMMDTPRKRSERACRVLSRDRQSRARRGRTRGASASCSTQSSTTCPRGVLMFDADMRLVFCNQGYVEMYGLSPDDGGRRFAPARPHRPWRGQPGPFTASRTNTSRKLLGELAKGKTSNDIIRRRMAAPSRS